MNERGLMRMLEPLRRRIMMTVGRSVIRSVNDDLGRQLAQIEIMKGELRDAVERMQEYGFTSVPHAGADAAVVFVSGNREQGIIIAVDDRRYRLTGLAAGEVAIHDDQGQKVHLTRTGIVVDTPFDLSAAVGGDVDVGVGGSVTATVVGAVSVTAPTVSITGNLNVTGSITATADISDASGSMGEMRTTYNSHVHGASSGPTPTMT